MTFIPPLKEYSLTMDSKELPTSRVSILNSTCSVASWKTTTLFATASSKVLGVTRIGAGFSSPGFPGLPTTIVNVCWVERLPPSVAVTVNVYVPSSNRPVTLPASLIFRPVGSPLVE